MVRIPLQIVMVEIMQITEDNNIRKEEGLEVEVKVAIWINIWNFDSQKYLTMKSWM
jgi:hypothetical protein